ncbi:YjbF family lipoprotein [Yoonia sp. 2307UL14-13]|uniref:YjbF family lipoprotein n=1 Tax=Yoonia sp. 2307UL14-13 TaxID=3126506 RepID=UPI0030B67A4B
MKIRLLSRLSPIIMLFLGACGPLAEGGIASQLTSVVTGGQEAPQPAAAPSREEILGNPGKFIRVNTRNRQRWDTHVVAGTNTNRSTWVDSENSSITFENGIVVATRGLPRDLMAADVSQSWAAIRAGGGEATRIHEYLTNMDQISTELLQCRIASQRRETVSQFKIDRNATRFEEKCESETLEFTNVYWVNDAGAVIRSLQAVSPDAGYLQIDVF